VNFDHPHIEHPALTEFAALAARYCGLVDRRDPAQPLAFIHDLHRLLPQVYAAALLLPSTEVLYSNSEVVAASQEEEALPPAAPDPDHPSPDDWRVLYRDLANYFGERNFYREIFDPFRPIEEEEEVLGALSDDVADIYSDLVTGLKKWERGESGGALWEWRFGLEHHWGEHASGAIRALHCRAACWDTWFPPS